MVDAVTYFTQGYCYELALEVQARTGWPLYALCRDHDDIGEYEEGEHALVQTPGGHYLDITGAHPAGELLAEWPHTHLVPVEPEFFTGWVESARFAVGHLDRRRVRRAADRILARLPVASVALAA